MDEKLRREKDIKDFISELAFGTVFASIKEIRETFLKAVEEGRPEWEYNIKIKAGKRTMRRVRRYYEGEDIELPICPCGGRSD